MLVIALCRPGRWLSTTQSSGMARHNPSRLTSDGAWALTGSQLRRLEGPVTSVRLNAGKMVRVVLYRDGVALDGQLGLVRPDTTQEIVSTASRPASEIGWGYIPELDIDNIFSPTAVAV